MIALRVRRLLRRRGLLDEDAAPSGEPPSALDACQAASLRGVTALGPASGRPLRKIVLPALASGRAAGHEERGAGGFDLDVGALVRAHERQRLERPCRYVLRPAIASERLELLPDGRVKYAFRHAWRHGTTAVVLVPSERIERLVALVPAPRRHLVRYHGTLAPSAAWRARIVPPGGEAPRSDAKEREPEPHRPARIAWADLLKRMFAVDVLQCPRCSGRMQIVATVTDLDAAKRILTWTGLPARERDQSEPPFQG